MKLGTFAAYIPLAPKDEESEHSEAAEDNPDAPRSATATAAAAGNQTQAITQPSSQGSALAEDRLKELKGGAIGLTTGAGRRLGGASDDTSELPTLAAADDAMQGAAAAAQGASAGKQSGAAAGNSTDNSTLAPRQTSAPPLFLEGGGLGRLFLISIMCYVLR